MGLSHAWLGYARETGFYKPCIGTGEGIILTNLAPVVLANDFLREVMILGKVELLKELGEGSGSQSGHALHGTGLCMVQLAASGPEFRVKPINSGELDRARGDRGH